MKLLQLAVEALAAYRLTRLILTDEITAPLRDPIRRWAAKREPAPGVDPMHTPTNHPKVLYLLECYWCMGLWCSTLVTAIAEPWSWPWWPLQLLAISALVGWLGTVIRQHD